MAFALAFSKGRQAAPEDTVAFGAVAERLRRAGDLEGAVAICRAGLERFPSHASARVTLGLALLAMGHDDEARVEFEQVLKQAPDNLLAVRGLAQLHGGGSSDGYGNSAYSSASSPSQPAGFWTGAADAQGVNFPRPPSESLNRIRSRVSDEDEDYAHSVLALKRFEEEQAVGAAAAAAPAAEPDATVINGSAPANAAPTPAEPLLTQPDVRAVPEQFGAPTLGGGSSVDGDFPTAGVGAMMVRSLPSPIEIIEPDRSASAEIIEPDRSASAIVRPTSLSLEPVQSFSDPELLAYESALPCPASVALGVVLDPGPRVMSDVEPGELPTLSLPVARVQVAAVSVLDNLSLVDDLLQSDDRLSHAPASKREAVTFPGFDFFQEFQSEDGITGAQTLINFDTAEAC